MILPLAKHTPRMRTILRSHLRRLLVTAALACLAVGAFIAQPKLTAPIPGKPPSMTLTDLNAPGPPPQTSATVTPGPEPWYTLFTTGEVVGYIEPCG